MIAIGRRGKTSDLDHTQNGPLGQVIIGAGGDGAKFSLYRGKFDPVQPRPR